MHAMVLDSHRSTLRAADIPIPKPGPGEVLIQANEALNALRAGKVKGAAVWLASQP
jgi:D-arabinose 1-dehydrogenase-like Zn-dependent alcohol dehydrogenase